MDSFPNPVTENTYLTLKTDLADGSCNNMRRAMISKQVQ